MPAQNDGAAQMALGNGGVLRVEAITRHVLQVRVSEDGCFEEPALVWHGIVEQATEQAPYRGVARRGSSREHGRWR